MKTFRSIAAIFVFAAIFAVSAFAQTTPTAASGKVGIVNTQAFDAEKGGITKYVNAMNSLEAEFKPMQSELQTMATKIQALETESQGYQKQLNDPNPSVPVDKTKIQTTAQTKYQEYEDLGRQFKIKQEDYKVKYERRQAALVAPISRDIGNALQEFTKKNGFMMIFDVSKDDKGFLLALDEKFDVTKDFITYYNARPATTAAVK
jgi:Skp family chaperone for outer membrane proteins